jgi:anti-anti-sigma regulatory factor
MREINLTMGTTLDRKGSKQLRKALKCALQSSGAICFDASGLQHADASGLAELFAMIAEVWERGGEAVVSGASANMRAIFELVQLDQVAEMRDASQQTTPMHIGVSQPTARPTYAGDLQPQMAS